MKCLYKRNPASGFVGQHRRFCGHFDCDTDAVNHVMVGNHWCANLCNQHTKYYRTRRDAEVSEQIILRGEDDERKQTKRRAITAR